MIELTEIADVLACQIAVGRARAFTGAAIDSKRVRPGDLFFALRGERADGHDYVGHAVEAGAAGAVLSAAVDLPPDVTVIRVADTLAALQALGAAHRRRHDPLVIAVTGSAGKTTTKDMITHLLRPGHEVLASPASYNNHLGVPLTLLDLDARHSHAVVELGTNHPGEIAPLARLASPGIGVLTSIGFAHIGNFGSQEAILAEKAALFDHLSSDGLCVVNGDDPHVRSLIPVLRDRGRRVLSAGFDAASDVCVERLAGAEDRSSGVIEHRGERAEFRWPWAGGHLVSAAALAIAAGVAGGAEFSAAAAALNSFTLPRGRAVSRRLSPRLRLIDDSYNASPDAMLSAVDLLASAPEPVRIAVLGEMRELGAFSQHCHETVGRAAASAATHLVTVGAEAEHVRRAAGRAGLSPARTWSAPHALAALEIAAAILESQRQECVVLFKGARFTHMERVGLGLSGVGVTCALPVCSLYVNCAECPQVDA